MRKFAQKTVETYDGPTCIVPIDESQSVKTITNMSMQSLTIYFQTEHGGSKEVFIRPHTSITVPVSWDSKILNTLIKRRLIKVVLNNN